MPTDKELDDELKFSVTAYFAGDEKEVKAELQKPTREEQRGGFVGLVKWAARVAVLDVLTDRVVTTIEHRSDDGKWHRLAKAEVNQTKMWVRVKGEFPRIII